MRLLDAVIVYSASDLSQAAACEFALLRRLDEQLGRVPKASHPEDPMSKRAAEMGFAHERRVLDGFVATHGPGVVVVDRPDHSRQGLEAARDHTLAALRGGAAVVTQGAFFDGRFSGFADFLVRVTVDGGVAYEVLDAKLARSAKVPALLQLAAYADQLTASGIPVAPKAKLILGDHTRVDYRLSDIVPVYRDRRRRLETLLDRHQDRSEAAVWGDPAFTSCGRCGDCDAEVVRCRDLLLVAGMRTTQRANFRRDGVDTIDRLATHTGDVDGISGDRLQALQSQAALQAGVALADGTVGDVSWVLHTPQHLRNLPPPSEGDIFFDFEGDPLWTDDAARDWGLEYLFGVVEPDIAGGVFRAFWAHDRSQEKRALLDFLDYVHKRRARWPDLHVYHYAPYEKSTLLRLAGRHGAGEDAVDQLLRDGVLIDLYSTVRHCLRVSQRSYSLKQLEPLYMGNDLRQGDVKDAGESLIAYATYCDLRDRGDVGRADEQLRSIANYNQYDCRSTWRLRDWLLARGAEAGVQPARPSRTATEPPMAEIADPLADRLLALVGDVPTARRSPDEQAVAMLAAAVGYHRREQKPFWWGHFDRLTAPINDWADTKDALIVESAVVSQDWHVPEGKRVCRRILELTGRLDVGSSLDAGSGIYCLYEGALPPGFDVGQGAIRAARQNGTIVAHAMDGTGRDVLTVVEAAKRSELGWTQLPMAISVGAPPSSTPLEAALRVLGEQVAVAWPRLPAHPALDILRLLDPRLTTAPALPDMAADGIETITGAVTGLDRSYVAVQGPPGTGKTYVGSHVVTRLVRQGWRIGVVAQSHAVVENFLQAVIQAGAPSSKVAKVPAAGGGPSASQPWTVLSANGQAAFLDSHSGGGCVVGGTSWDLTNPNRFAPNELDLLVIEEAGQYSIADTLAVSISAQRLLLLGDPQQLPQVSQGTHPEPVDGSGLGWLSQGADTLPGKRGYFLERTWRMHPVLTAPVSTMSYEGRLLPQLPQTTRRSMPGVDPGLHIVYVDHTHNSVQSSEEASAVLHQVQGFVGRDWRDDFGTRTLQHNDVLVVAPYNAQVDLIRRRLREAGIGGVRVGTVDKLQGQQAPVVIVSMTASAVAEVPRGMSFLLNRNRVNVAISRAQWCAVLIRSPALTDYLPTSPAGLVELGAFVGLCDR